MLTLMTAQTDGSAQAREVHHTNEAQEGYGDGPEITTTSDELEIICGPLINYQRLSEENGQSEWHGSVLIVTKLGPKLPQLELQSLGAWDDSSAPVGNNKRQLVDGLKLYADPDKTFWRFTIVVPLSDVQTKWQYSIPAAHFLSSVSKEKERVFVVPSKNESMRLMFHSCNGFSVGTDEDFWSGKRQHRGCIVQQTDISKVLHCGMMY